MINEKIEKFKRDLAEARDVLKESYPKGADIAQRHYENRVKDVMTGAEAVMSDVETKKVYKVSESEMIAELKELAKWTGKSASYCFETSDGHKVELKVTRENVTK